MTDIGPVVLKDLEHRIRQGRAKYNRPLTAHTLERPLWEMYEELLDAVIYARAAIERLGQVKT